MRKFLIQMIGLMLAMTTTACAEQTTPVGVWELRYQDAVGQSYLNVLELRKDGTYATHMQDATPSDTGRYTLTDTMVTFESRLDPRFSRDVPYELDGDTTLKLLIVAPGGGGNAFYVDWTRSSLTRQLRIIEIFERRVPGDLPSRLAAFASEAQKWKEDAVPTWIRMTARQNGEYETILHFFSPSTMQELRMTVTAYDIKTSTHNGSRTAHRPLPPEFLDLPLLLIKANENQITGPLEKADLSVYEQHGAVWQITMTNRQRGSFSAETGAKIDGDVTGYKAQYEADWNHAGELWRKAMKQWQKDDSNGEFHTCPMDPIFDHCPDGCYYHSPSPPVVTRGWCSIYY
jgi:hypothetical protein